MASSTNLAADLAGTMGQSEKNGAAAASCDNEDAQGCHAYGGGGGQVEISVSNGGRCGCAVDAEGDGGSCGGAERLTFTKLLHRRELLLCRPQQLLPRRWSEPCSTMDGTSKFRSNNMQLKIGDVTTYLSSMPIMSIPLCYVM
uniref:Uncharacterized protein n=1 Tax=Leersia perrieri TaxID=77586 RepID=A0A0D9VC14_9ORYZ